MLKQGLRAVTLWRQSPRKRENVSSTMQSNEMVSVRDNLVLKYYGTRISLSSQ